MFEFQFKDIPENGSFAGKTVVLQTPDDKPVDIDVLPAGEPLTEEEINDYFNFHKKVWLIHGKTYPATQIKITPRIHRCTLLYAEEVQNTIARRRRIVYRTCPIMCPISLRRVQAIQT